MTLCLHSPPWACPRSYGSSLGSCPNLAARCRIRAWPSHQKHHWYWLQPLALAPSALDPAGTELEAGAPTAWRERGSESAACRQLPFLLTFLNAILVLLFSFVPTPALHLIFNKCFSCSPVFTPNSEDTPAVTFGIIRFLQFCQVLYVLVIGGGTEEKAKGGGLRKGKDGK